MRQPSARTCPGRRAPRPASAHSIRIWSITATKPRSAGLTRTAATLRRSRPGAGQVSYASWRAGRWWAAVPGVSRVLLVLVEDGHDLGQGWSPPMLPKKTMQAMPMTWGAASAGPDTEMTLGDSWPATSARRMPGRSTGDVVGGDRAVGGDPGGLGGQRLPGGAGQGGADPAGDGQAAGDAADQGAAGAQRHIGPPAASPPPPSRDRAAWSRCGSAAAYGAVRPSDQAARPARRAPLRSARLRVLVCTKQTGAASNAAWQASPFKTVTTWTPCTACNPVGSAW